MTEPMMANDAEVSLIGAALSGYGQLDEVLEAVDAADFYHPARGEVWNAIGRVHASGAVPDPVSVRVSLDEAGIQHDPILLLTMAQQVPIVSQADYYAEQVLNAAGMRRLQDAGTKVQKLGTSAGSLEDRREQARQVVDEATRGKNLTRARTIADVLPGVLDIAENGQANVLPTGYPDVDRVIGGLAPGRLVIVGARPGVGKSLMGTNLALHFASHHKHAVLLASLEMPEDEVGQRMLAAHAGVNLTTLQNGTVDERSWGRIAERHAELVGMPVSIVDDPSQTVASIRRHARDLQRSRDDLALIVVDYLQLVTTAGSTRNRSEELGEVSRGLKLLARETGACVVAMAQVNREGTKHGDGRPKMSDLRESGSIEADADVVMLLHQPDDEIPEIEVLIDKNRHGPRGMARLQIQGHYARLASVGWSPSSAVS